MGKVFGGSKGGVFLVKSRVYLIQGVLQSPRGQPTPPKRRAGKASHAVVWSKGSEQCCYRCKAGDRIEERKKLDYLAFPPCQESIKMKK
jgi:hypothetical protein